MLVHKILFRGQVSQHKEMYNNHSKSHNLVIQSQIALKRIISLATL
jgi:hypothetical protein